MNGRSVFEMESQMLEQQRRAEAAERKLAAIARLLERAETDDNRYVDGLVVAAILRGGD